MLVSINNKNDIHTYMHIHLYIEKGRKIENTKIEKGNVVILFYFYNL